MDNDIVCIKVPEVYILIISSALPCTTLHCAVHYTIVLHFIAHRPALYRDEDSAIL